MANQNAIPVVRSKSVLITVPGILGLSDLTTPYEYDGDKKFKLQIHHTDEQFNRLGQQLDEFVVEPLWDDWVRVVNTGKGGDPMLKEPKGGWQKPNGDDWVIEHQKPAAERSKTQTPYMQYANDAEYKDRKTGEIIQKTMKAYDAKGATLDLPSLKLGMGSIIQAVVLPGLFANSLIKQPSISLKLQGIRVISLKQWGSSGPSMGEVSEADMALLGDDIEADDLSAYAGVHDAMGKARAAIGMRQQEELDDDIPF